MCRRGIRPLPSSGAKVFSTMYGASESWASCKITSGSDSASSTTNERPLPALRDGAPVVVSGSAVRQAGYTASRTFSVAFKDLDGQAVYSRTLVPA